MLVFVDESGDPGMKGKDGSSNQFVVAAVWFEDRDDANACDARINDIRKELRLSPRAEFHFNRDRKEIRKYFLEQVAPFQFFYFGMVINKHKLNGPGFQFKDSFYKYSVRLLFENAKPFLKEAIVVIDGSGRKDFRSQLAKYLRARMTDGDGNCAIKKVKIQASHSNNLLQLSDVVCGAIARSLKHDKQDRRIYRDIIRHRELNVQTWPR